MNVFQEGLNTPISLPVWLKSMVSIKDCSYNSYGLIDPLP